MGVMGIGKNRYWGDHPQDEVDEYLERLGFIFDKEYSNEQYKKFYKRAYNNKTMFKKFSSAFKFEIGRKPFKAEYKYHIVFGLGSPKCLK